MPITLTELLLIKYFAILTRVTGFCLVAPIFASKWLPRQFRLILILSLTFAFYWAVPESPSVSEFNFQGALFIAANFGIGYVMGYIFYLIFQTFFIAAQTIAMQMGLGFATLNDPNSGGSASILGALFNLVALFFFINFDGLQLLVNAILSSFAIGYSEFGFVEEASLREVTASIAYLFQAAVRLGLPTIITLLFVNFSLGILTRAAPQLNLFSLGFPVMLIIGLILTYITMSMIEPILSLQIEFFFSLFERAF